MGAGHPIAHPTFPYEDKRNLLSYWASSMSFLISETMPHSFIHTRGRGRARAMFPWDDPAWQHLCVELTPHGAGDHRDTGAESSRRESAALIPSDAPSGSLVAVSPGRRGRRVRGASWTAGSGSGAMCMISCPPLSKPTCWPPPRPLHEGGLGARASEGDSWVSGGAGVPAEAARPLVLCRAEWPPALK